MRKGLKPLLRRELEGALETHLKAVIAAMGIFILGGYWPFRGEFDPRPLFSWFLEKGGNLALPAVVDKKGPLEYRAWRPGERLVDGVWGIPTPEERRIVVPAAVLVPLVGFDRSFYRLGYGGGFFDRTLAALEPKPLAIGIGFEALLIETIDPQPYDVPMDLIVTEKGVRRRAGAGGGEAQ